MVFIRTKKVNGQCYIYLVKNYWTDKGSRQRVIAHLGKARGFDAKVIKKVMDRDGHCQMCGRMDDLCIDHKRPLSKGGSNDISNLQVLCRRCNGVKGRKLLPEFEKIPEVAKDEFYW